jgi:Na+-transporting methylmalonyl-CoA/oxaloacetate decarboxylase gamma subunit
MKTFDRGHVLGVGFILLALAMVIQGLWVQSERQAEQDCQTEYNQDVTAVIAQRATWADEDRTALNTMIFAVVNPTLDDAAKRRALDDYVETAQTNENRRQASPLPTYHC